MSVEWPGIDGRRRVPTFSFEMEGTLYPDFADVFQRDLLNRYLRNLDAGLGDPPRTDEEYAADVTRMIELMDSERRNEQGR